MNVKELRKHFAVQNNSQLAAKLKRGRSTIHGWEENGIPISVQAMLELTTKGKLKADREQLQQ